MPAIQTSSLLDTCYLKDLHTLTGSFSSINRKKVAYVPKEDTLGPGQQNTSHPFLTALHHLPALGRPGASAPPPSSWGDLQPLAHREVAPRGALFSTHLPGAESLRMVTEYYRNPQHRGASYRGCQLQAALSRKTHSRHPSLHRSNPSEAGAFCPGFNGAATAKMTNA